MEYYRRNVLPDLVRYYRGIFVRRQIDQNSAFGDLVAAQQMLSSNVTAYTGILGSLWSSAVSVADFLQTDDLFQVAKRRELPELPDFNALQDWACGHDTLAASFTDRTDVRGPLSAAPAVEISLSAPAGGPPGGLPAVRQARRFPGREPAERCQARPRGIMKSKSNEEEDHEARDL